MRVGARDGEFVKYVRLDRHLVTGWVTPIGKMSPAAGRGGSCRRGDHGLREDLQGRGAEGAENGVDLEQGAVASLAFVIYYEGYPSKPSSSHYQPNTSRRPGPS